MKKEMFNEKYGLTTAVLEGRKTQTRRIAYDFRQHTCNKVTKSVILPSGSITYMDGVIQVLDDMPKPLYKIGEDVAIAQNYRDANVTSETVTLNGITETFYFGDWMPGWNNKMFVRADLMPHRIRITNVRVERLQDISEEDCLKEGIIQSYNDCLRKNIFGFYDGNKKAKLIASWKVDVGFDTPREAFASLINKICGRGTWDSNPWVFVYDFELVK